MDFEVYMSYVKQLKLKHFILRDERGWAINPFEVADLLGESAGNLHVVSMKPGAIRGNHYHPDATEWLLFCEGPAKLVWRSRGDDSIHEYLIEGEEPALFEIPPGFEHAVKNISDDAIYLMAFYDTHDPATVGCSPLV
ncbi:MAG: hypothetical protein IMF10_05260 [Proteobacteria bacterium]|nr:hypothetical protein [Pseudomonadota bacterium]